MKYYSNTLLLTQESLSKIQTNLQVTGEFMGKVKSKDGTLIAYQRSGSGQALVLVHGTGADHTRWAPVMPLLRKHFTIIAVDRRGRGQSGDADAYAIEREFEDVAAVVDSIGGQVNLLGHSFGAQCCLEAALRTSHIRRLILYEPPITTEGVFYPPGVRDIMQVLLKAGDREGLLTTFLRELVGMSDYEISSLKAEPTWTARLAAAHSILRELPDEGYILDLKRFRNVRIPALLLLGGNSPPFLVAATKAVHAALQNSTVLVMPGQQHVAMNTAPEFFVHEVVAFLRQPD